MAHIKKFYIILCLFYLAPLSAQAAESSLTYLQKTAVDLKLYEKPGWLNLLHYKQNTFSKQFYSEIERSAFFLSSQGRVNPGRELLATLRAMFTEVRDRNPNQHPQCLFVARRDWLVEKLEPIVGTIPLVSCPEFNKWIESTAPYTATLIFPVASVNSPSSMFGHSLLKIAPQTIALDADTITLPPQEKPALAISFAPYTDDNNNFFFGIKNLLGFYDGKFNIERYEDKIQEYNNIENRDAWEYTLNLSDKETRRIMTHLWELRDIKFNYFYLYENSAYQILSLLDVARPELDITSTFTLTVMPVDTLRAIVDAGLVDKIHYKPSTLSNLDYQLAQYAAEDLKIIMGLAKGHLRPDDSEFITKSKVYQIFLLEIANKYLQFSYKKGDIETEEFETRFRNILQARTHLDQSIILPTAPTPKSRPDQGHNTARMILSGGEHNKVKFVELNWRPAYHDLLDDSSGHSAYAKANFLDIAARLDDATGRLRLQHLNIIDIFSQTPRTTFFSPISWKFRTGLNRLPVLADNETLVFNANGGVGLTYQPLDPLRVYLLAEASTVLSSRFDYKISFAAGPNLGFLWQVSDNWKMWLDSSYLFYDSQNNSIQYQNIDLAQSYQIKKNLALRVHIKREGIKQSMHNELQLSMHMYF